MQLAGPIVIAVAMVTAGLSYAAELTVEVTGLASGNGDVHVALYNDADRFPDSDGMIAKLEVPIKGTSSSAVFRNLSPGRYAVAVYHDENANDEFDQGIFGIPLEDYGFSNDAPVFLGPPSFADAGFNVPEAGTRIEINLEN